MSTNFYIRTPDDVAVAGEGEHIGKRSAGWVFNFEARNHKTLAAWRRRLDSLGDRETVTDEYGAPYTTEEFWNAVYATREYQGRPGRVMDEPGESLGDILRAALEARGDFTGASKFRKDSYLDGGFRFSNYKFC